MSNRTFLFMAASSMLAVAASSMLLATACQDTSNAAAKAAGPVSVGKCKYTVSPRSEYTELFTPKDSGEALLGKTSATPNFRKVRLGLGGEIKPGSSSKADPSTSIAIAWETDTGTNASWVQFGTTPDPAGWKDKEFGIAYVVPEIENNVGSQAQQLHEVHLCDLKPNTTYYYRVGGGPEGQEVWSDVLSFRTTPADAETEVTLAITGDSRGNQGNAWQILTERLYKRGDITAQLFSGDIVDLAFFHEQYQEWLSKGEFDTAGKRSMMGQVLTLVAMGNHEFYNPQFFATIVQPQDPAFDRKYDELFFSTNIGPVHVIVVDDERIGKPSGDQDYTGIVTGWLKEDLAAIDRAKQPWVVAVHHRPEFSSSLHGDEADVIQVRKTLSPIWDEFKVDVVFTGHDHNYERTKPLQINNGEANIGQGTTYVVCAGAGSDGYSNGNKAFTQFSYKYDDAGNLGVYGIMKASKTKLSFNAYALTSGGADPEIDKFELTK